MLMKMKEIQKIFGIRIVSNKNIPSGMALLISEKDFVIIKNIGRFAWLKLLLWKIKIWFFRIKYKDDVNA